VSPFRLTATAATASDAASLMAWLRRQGQEVVIIVAPGSMGAGEVIGSTLAGTAALKAFVAIAREWIRAHRTSITVEVDGRGRFEVQGTTDIDQLVALMTSQDGNAGA